MYAGQEQRKNMNDKMIPYLNPQVTEVILSYVDGKCLARCEQVCKLWKDLVRSLSQRTHIWKTCCVKEISRDVRIDLLNNCYPGWHDLSLRDSEWKIVYKTWCQWHHVGKWAFITKTLFEDTSLRPVTCMKTSGTCVTTGHNNGDVLLWCYSNYVKVTSHKKCVTDLGVMVYGGECKNYSDQLKHNLVVSTSEDHTVHINPLMFQNEKPYGFPVVIREHFLCVAMVRTFGSMFAVLSYDGRISIWQLNTPTYNKKVPEVIKLHTLRISSDLFRAVSIWGSKDIQVSAMTSNGLCIPIFRGGHSCPYKLLQEEAHFLPSNMWEEIHGRILKIFLWRYGISIVLTDHHYMHISVNGCKQTKYNTMPYFNSHPVTILLYGEILLLGMESGTLYMYLLSQITDLLTLDLGAVYWQHSLCSDPVIALDIAETSNGPVIAAATNNKVFCIPFILPQLR